MSTLAEQYAERLRNRFDATILDGLVAGLLETQSARIEALEREVFVLRAERDRAQQACEQIARRVNISDNAPQT
jgi:hypothetical protein